MRSIFYPHYSLNIVTVNILNRIKRQRSCSRSFLPNPSWPRGGHFDPLLLGCQRIAVGAMLHVTSMGTCSASKKHRGEIVKGEDSQKRGAPIQRCDNSRYSLSAENRIFEAMTEKSSHPFEHARFKHGVKYFRELWQRWVFTTLAVSIQQSPHGCLRGDPGGDSSTLPSITVWLHDFTLWCQHYPHIPAVSLRSTPQHIPVGRQAESTHEGWVKCLQFDPPSGLVVSSGDDGDPWQKQILKDGPSYMHFIYIFWCFCFIYRFYLQTPLFPILSIFFYDFDSISLTGSSWR